MSVVSQPNLQSSAEYLQAASYYPVDEEKHTWYLHIAFDVLFEIGGPVEYLLTILNKL
ncbi:hypothetical protein LXA43DRAFT_1088369 [Ganoderma leucocontextum]|nr:hypothetical protein LXA43DRAFT_1088369 [Ganoderma leucocontextum]